MKSPRLTRLENDFLALTERFADNEFVTVQPMGPLPPDKYRIIYRVPSLRTDGANRPTEASMTVIEISLPNGYPREKPYVISKEKVFHPNFGDYVCIADFWSPSQNLADIIVEIGQMLQWQKYNIQSPLNAVAADWAVKNMDKLPLAEVRF
jgi:ubiquitin-protein ligase